LAVIHRTVNRELMARKVVKKEGVSSGGFGAEKYLMEDPD
jgi:hypothetical protein